MKTNSATVAFGIKKWDFTSMFLGVCSKTHWRKYGNGMFINKFDNNEVEPTKIMDSMSKN